MGALVVRTRPIWLGAIAITALLAGLVIVPSQARAAEATVGLGTAASYSVLGGQTVTNTGPSVLGGDLGVSPGTAITGFPPGVAGAIHAGDTQAAQAQLDVAIAYNDAASRAPTSSVAGDLVGRTLTAGVYNSTSTLALTGTATLNAEGDPNAVFVFQIATALTTGSASHINLINGAQPCNVFWKLDTATLGTNSTFVGTILALTSISVQTGTTVEGRTLARNGQVSLDTNTFTTPACNTSVTTTTTTAPPAASVAPTITPAPAPPTPVARQPSFTG